MTSLNITHLNIDLSSSAPNTRIVTKFRLTTRKSGVLFLAEARFFSSPSYPLQTGFKPTHSAIQSVSQPLTYG